MKTDFIVLLSAILLVGCAQMPAPTINSWKSHQAQLENLNEWDLTGKIAFITPDERHSFNMHWSQSGDDFHISLTTFLGSTVLDVLKNQSGTEITDNNGDQNSADDAEILIEQLSGLVIPIDRLQQWVKGNPTAASYELDKSNQVASLVGRDKRDIQWLVNYSDYKTTQQISLPYKIQLQRSDLRLKFAISKWEISQKN